MDDRTIWPVALRAVECLREQIIAAEVPVPQFIGVLPGAVTIQDYAADCGGQAWVRVVNVYPSSSFPTPDTGIGSLHGTLAATLEIGITRCAVNPASNGMPPSPHDDQEMARQQMADMRVIYRTLMCCLDPDASSLGTYSPIGPEGGYVGGAWRAVVMQDA